MPASPNLGLKGRKPGDSQVLQKEILRLLWFYKGPALPWLKEWILLSSILFHLEMLASSLLEAYFPCNLWELTP